MILEKWHCSATLLVADIFLVSLAVSCHILAVFGNAGNVLKMRPRFYAHLKSYTEYVVHI